MTGDKFRDVALGDKTNVPDITRVISAGGMEASSGEHPEPMDHHRGCPARRLDRHRDSQKPIEVLEPLAVCYKRAGYLIDRSSRTIRRMVDRGELVGIRGHALVEYKSLVNWVEERAS